MQLRKGTFLPLSKNGRFHVTIEQREEKTTPWNSRALLIDVHSSKYLHSVVVHYMFEPS